MNFSFDFNKGKIVNEVWSKNIGVIIVQMVCKKILFGWQNKISLWICEKIKQQQVSIVTVAREKFSSRRVSVGEEMLWIHG